MVASREPPQLKKIEAPLSLEATVAEANRALTVRWAIRNDGDRRVYVYDRPPAYESDGKLVDDPDAPYRFIRDGRLRILFGDAPLPRLGSVSTRVFPHCTAVEPGATLTRTVAIPTPVTEHSVYWKLAVLRRRAPDAKVPPIEETRVTAVDLLIDYVVDQLGLVTREALEGATHFEYPGVVHDASVRLHRAMPVAIAGRRRVEIDARPLLPGEAPEPMPPYPVSAEED